MAEAITGWRRAKDWTFFRGEFVTAPDPPPRGRATVGRGDIDFARNLESRRLPEPVRMWRRVVRGMARCDRSLPWRLPGSPRLPSGEDES
jgi:hypothetical protein